MQSTIEKKEGRFRDEKSGKKEPFTDFLDKYHLVGAFGDFCFLPAVVFRDEYEESHGPGNREPEEHFEIKRG